MRLALRTAALALAALAVCAPAARADVSAVGYDGESYTLRHGTYGELFPGGGLAAAGSWVLALDISYRDGAVDRLLVPQTEDPARDESASLILEPTSQTPFIVWQAWKNVHPRLNLVQLTPGGWTPVVELSGSPFNLKGSPSFVVTRDHYDLEGEDGATVHRERTIVHLVWWERIGDALRVFYSPVVLEDGVYLGQNPVHPLTDLAAALEPAGGEPTTQLLESLSIQAGDDDRSAVIGFTDQASGRLVTVEARVLPGELSALGDAVRAQLVDLGSRIDLDDPGAVQSMSDVARAQLVDLGSRFHPSFVAYLAEQLDAFIADWLGGEGAGAPGDVEALAGGARAQLVDLGSRLESGGLDGGGGEHVLLDFSAFTEGSLHHLISLAPVTSWPAPRTGAAPTWTFVSRSGDDVLVAWRRGGGVAYRESRGEALSDEYFLPAAGDPGTIAAILRRLDDRTRDR